MKNLRRLGLAGLVLAVAMLKTGCPVLPEPTLRITLPEGPYHYSIQIRNTIVVQSSNPEDYGWWINQGEKEITVPLVSGVSYDLEPEGYDIDFKDGKLILLRYYSKEGEIHVWGEYGKQKEVEFTMSENPVISFTMPID